MLRQSFAAPRQSGTLRIRPNGMEGLTVHINDVEQLLSKVTGQVIFDRSIYYFNEIPTDVQPIAVLSVNLGAIAIATVFSILPALRAAMLHPVQALRYE